MNLRAFIFAALATLVASLPLAGPAVAQDAKLICSTDAHGRPTRCIDTTGKAIPDPVYYRERREPRPAPVYTPPYAPQPYYAQPAYQQTYPAPDYYQPAYPAADDYAPAAYPAPQASGCTTRKRGLFTNWRGFSCGHGATYSITPQAYPAYAPYPQQSYYPQPEPYPQYSYYQSSGYVEPRYGTRVTARPRPYKPPPPPQRVYGPWPSR